MEDLRRSRLLADLFWRIKPKSTKGVVMPASHRASVLVDLRILEERFRTHADTEEKWQEDVAEKLKIILAKLDDLHDFKVTAKTERRLLMFLAGLMGGVLYPILKALHLVD